MSPPWAAPPAADSCLVRPYRASSRMQKGGTAIAAEVVDLETHERRLDEGRYRPERCPSPACGGTTLHAHGTRTRSLKGALGALAPPLLVMVALFRCVGCSGVWRVLPGFIPRWLHYPWRLVHRVLDAEASRSPTPVPARTRRRWVARAGQEGRVPRQVLATSGSPRLRGFVAALGLSPARAALVAAFAPVSAPRGPWESLAALLHRLAPGIRLV